MPRKGYISITLPEPAVQIIDKYIEQDRTELEFKYGRRGLRSAVVREAILLLAKEKGISLEKTGQ